MTKNKVRRTTTGDDILYYIHSGLDTGCMDESTYSSSLYGPYAHPEEAVEALKSRGWRFINPLIPHTAKLSVAQGGWMADLVYIARIIEVMGTPRDSKYLPNVDRSKWWLR